MAKPFARQSTVVFSLVILGLLIVCVGLLVAVLKGQVYHESLGDDTVSSHRIEVTTAKPAKERHGTPNPESPNVVQTEVEESTETVTEMHEPSTLPWENFRLSSRFKPVHYDLILHPDLKSDNFTGNVTITVNVTEFTDNFVMHAFRLNVFHPKVFNVYNQVFVDVRHDFLYDPNEFYVIELEYLIHPGIYEISLEFSGSLADKIVGFYKSRYTNSATNETRYLATSKFQPTYARRAFPCFDEPNFKSTFTVSLVHDPDYIALSNMPAEETVPYLDGHQRVTKFKKSVPMVTYLTCFIVCDFEYLRTTTSGEKEFRVYATADNVRNAGYALNFGSEVLKYFEEYFGIPYTLPKQDMVAIPDFVSGAMEHWGVITFRETNILYDPAKSSPQNKQWVTAVISHEMAHMWFGNLVTMEWWDDLWLNEGFASYIEYKGVNKLHPEWHMLEQFVTESMQPVMDLDSTMNSHPIVQPVSHPDEITEIFDDISYNKGASVLRMLEFFIGEETFRDGISRFLKKYYYGNARTEDLWEELTASEHNDLNISAIMGTWTRQMGFPFISISRDSHNSTVFTAKQRRFVKNREIYNKFSQDDEYYWQIPLSFVTSKGATGIVWLHNRSSEIFEVPAKESEWVKFNVNQTGYYIVNYDDKQWERLTELLQTNHQALTPSDRSNLIFDAFFLAEAGHIKYDVLLSMITYLKHEEHLVPWETAYASLVSLSQLLESTEVDPLIKRYIKELTEPLYQKLGWEESTDHLNNLLRNTIIGLACHSGNQDCLSTTATLLKKWINGTEIPTTLRRLVFHYGMAEIGRKEHWNLIWDRYLNTESPQERKTLLYGLSHVRVPSLIHRFLDYALNESLIRRQDFFSVLNYLAGNPAARPIVWNFLRNKWEALVDRFSLNDRYLGLSVKKVCTHFTSEDDLNEMQLFFEKYPDAGAGKRRRKQALENVANAIQWLKTYQDQLRTWFLVESPAPWLHYKLPPHIVPQHYHLILHPKVDNSSFSGVVSIDIELKIPSNYVLIHARKLNISKTEITRMDNASKITVSDVFDYENNTYLVIKFKEKVPSGLYKLYFEFNGNFSSDVLKMGMYRTSYNDPNGNLRMLIGTQFEDTYARSVFPCFDEPTFKATYTVSIKHNPENVVLSNGLELETTSSDDGLMITKFEKTVPMVTYLLCIVIGDLGYKETYTENGARLRIYTVPHNVEKTEFALDVGNKLLSFFENYFGCPYPLKKLDFVAIPGIEGAMENWGLVTFADVELLIDNSSSLKTIEEVTSLISHELAHMWFGNLVTMKWWNDLWLNEGFATYMSYKGAEKIHPSWNYADQFVSHSLQSALRKDATIFSRSVVHSARTLTEIGQMFDAISYNKGAAVLRMLEILMGDDFRKGLMVYLEKHAYLNVDTNDLWAEMSAASTKGLNVRSLMNTWTKQMNYPFINITRSESDPRKITASQHHFVLESNNTEWNQNSPYSYVWHVPLTYHTSDDPTLHFVMLNSSRKVIMDLPNAKWIKFNANFSGYYLVNYDKEDWYNFRSMLLKDPLVLSQTDRANLLHDSFALAKAGHLPYEVPLNFSMYLRHEMQLLPWTIANDIFSRLGFNEDDTKHRFREYIRVLSKDLYEKLAWKDTGDYSERLLRKVMIQVACKHKNYDCLQKTKHLLQKWLDGESISSEYRQQVYFFGIESLHDEASFRQMWDKYLNETDHDDKMDILSGLANTRNYTHCKWLLTYAEDEKNVAPAIYLHFLTMLSENLNCDYTVFDFMTRNWTQLQHRFGSERTILENFMKTVNSNYKHGYRLSQVREFFEKYPEAGVNEKERSEILEKIRNNIHWSDKYEPKIQKWLSEHVYMPWFNFRLPDHTIPSKYDLIVQPNVSTGAFHGEVNVTLNVLKPTMTMMIHALTLDVTDVELKDSSTLEKILIDEIFPFEARNVWVIYFTQQIPLGEYKLYAKFSGIAMHYQHGKGILRNTYTNNITKEVVPFLYTTFEPTHARKFFPCFDEPSMKATFRLAIVHEPRHFVISNMPEEYNMTRPDGLIQTQFTESVVMSTYLLCVVVSDFTYIETNITHGKKLRYYAPPDRVNGTLHTLETAPKILKIFEEYYDIPYHLPKLDFVAIPNFSSGGMENWGLIEYRDTLLVKEGDSREHLINSDRVVAHELAHQWFGNLVTMCWWNDIWLNEGFSSFAMYIPLRELYHEVDEVVTMYSEYGKIADAETCSHPIVYNVSHPSEIRRMFDAISYRKGSAILIMLASFMKDDFRTGVRNYLKKYAFKNAETNDFWDELSAVSTKNINISEVMDTWTRQRGYPYIEIAAEEKYFNATQRLFIIESEHTPNHPKMESDYGYIWKIPLTLKNLDTGEEQSHWFNYENATFPLKASAGDCLKFNVNYSGYYIIKYDEKGWDCLSQKLRRDHEVFSTVDRINILFDAILLAKADHIMYDVPLELTKYMRKERNYGPWEIAWGNLFIKLFKYLKLNSRPYRLLQKYTCYLINDVYEDVLNNKTGRSDFDRPIRNLASVCLHPKFIESRIPDLNKFLNGEGYPADGFWGILPQWENETLWQELWDQISNKNMSEHKYEMLSALAMFKDHNLLQRTFDRALTDESLDKEDTLHILNRLIDNPVFSEVVWNFIKSNWTEVTQWKSDSMYMLLRSRRDFITTEEELQDLVETYTIHKIDFNSHGTKMRLKWLRRNEETISNWIYWNLPTEDLL